MIVMGGIVGSGIFINPYVVAQHVHTPFLILGVWLAGGALAMLGAFIWAELATRLPGAGGQYLYLREAYHPVGGVRLWLGAAAGDADRRDGGGGGDLRALLSRDHRLRRQRRRHRGRGAAGADGHQLPGRARRQQRAERAHAA